jgi:CHORD protein
VSAGWKCCKPRVLTFEEFMSIPPCTEGKHSTTDLPPQIEKKTGAVVDAPSALSEPAVPRAPIATPSAPPKSPAPPPESEDDDPALAIPDGRTCRRRGCDATYKEGASRDDEKCVHHPGVPLFHEGSKGYTCCKRRVLEFDQFLKLEGCETKGRHLFVGSGKRDAKGGAGGSASSSKTGDGGEELLESVR